MTQPSVKKVSVTAPVVLSRHLTDHISTGQYVSEANSHRAQLGAFELRGILAPLSLVFCFSAGESATDSKINLPIKEHR